MVCSVSQGECKLSVVLVSNNPKTNSYYLFQVYSHLENVEYLKKDSWNTNMTIKQGLSQKDIISILGDYRSGNQLSSGN